MIPMSCPKCGAGGEIPLDKLNKRLHCRKCGTYFYVDDSGTVHLGDPNDPKKAKKLEHEHEPYREVQIDFDPMGSFHKLPPVLRVGVVFALLGLLVLGGSAFLRLFRGGGTDLTRNAQRVAAAFLSMQPDGLKSYTNTSNEKQAMGWYNVLRAKLPQTILSESTPDVTVTSSMLSQGDQETQTVTTVILGPSLQTKGGPPPVLTYPLVWRNDEGQWRVDFATSLKAYIQMNTTAENAVKMSTPAQQTSAGASTSASGTK